MSKSLLLFTLLTLAAGQSTVPCSITGTILAEASIADAPSGVVDQTVYIFPHICDEGHGIESPCHYYCDTTNDQGWKQDKSANHSISWVGAASAVGELSDGTEALFMMGGGPTNAPLDHFVYVKKRRRSNVALSIVHSSFIVFSVITAFQQTQTVSLTAFKLFSLCYNFTTTLLLRRYFDF
jgi:hypothetical protein